MVTDEVGTVFHGNYETTTVLTNKRKVADSNCDSKVHSHKPDIVYNG